MTHNDLIAQCFGEASTCAGRDLAIIAECVVAGMTAYLHPESAAAFERGTCLNQLLSEEIIASLLHRSGGDISAAAVAMPAAVQRALQQWFRLIADDTVETEATVQYRAHLRTLLARI